MLELNRRTKTDFLFVNKRQASLTHEKKGSIKKEESVHA